MLTDVTYFATFYLIIPVVYICILGPFEALVHELAHALTSRILTKQPSQVFIGIVPQDDDDFDPATKRPRTLTFSIAGIAFHLKPFMGPVGFAYWDPVDEHELWTYLSGPLASLLLVIIFSVTTYFARSHTNAFSIWYYLNEFAAIAAFLQFLFTIIPMRYPSWWWKYAGYPSDGYQVLHTLRSRQKTVMVQQNEP